MNVVPYRGGKERVFLIKVTFIWQFLLSTKI